MNLLPDGDDTRYYRIVLRNAVVEDLGGAKEARRKEQQKADQKAARERLPTKKQVSGKNEYAAPPEPKFLHATGMWTSSR